MAAATVHQAYRFALDPTPRQQGALASAVGGARFAYNWGLELVKQRLDARAAGQQVEVPWTLPALRREWNHAKHQAAPWWADNSKEAYSSGLDGLARALKNWADSRHGRRNGRRVGFPRFKQRGRRDACRFTTGAIRVLADRKHIQLPRIGVIKTHESTRKLARHLERGTGRILAATITRVADRWYVAFTCEMIRELPASNGHTSTVGVDAGVRQLAVLSTGEQIANPRPLERTQRKRRRLQRQWHRQECQRITTGRRHPSRRQQQTRRRIAKLEARAASIRRDGPQADQPIGTRAWQRGCRAAQRPRDAAQSPAGPGDRGCRVRAAPPAAGLQVPVAWRQAGSRRPVLSVQQDLLGLWCGESQAAPRRAGISLPASAVRA
jgi:putative transposase